MHALTRLNPTDPVRFDSMNAILGEIEGRDEDLLNKINVLEGLANGFKMYKSISELGLSMGAPMKEIGKAMKDNSMLITYMRKADYPESPTNYGILEVVKVSANYISYTWKTSVSSAGQSMQILYMAHYHTGLDLWTGWQQIATTTYITSELMSMLKVQYINTGTHTLSDYKEQGIYCFGSGCTITDIPVGVNGWLIVLPSNRTIPSTDIKQIWMRWGTPTTNSWMTYERLINPSSIGDWTYIGPPIKTEIPFPFNVGFENENATSTSAQTSSLIKVGNEVEVIGNIRKTDKTAFAKGDIAMTLPSGYRPLKNLRISASCYPYGTNASLLIDKASGKVIVQAVSSTNISVLSFIVKFNV